MTTPDPHAIINIRTQPAVDRFFPQHKRVSSAMATICKVVFKMPTTEAEEKDKAATVAPVIPTSSKEGTKIDMTNRRFQWAWTGRKFAMLSMGIEAHIKKLPIVKE
mmetsp:Transcript_55828/g.92357  ORF Transcript_55828/g.92357 Transcript_55828/m.92357 type:complete len:106 (+) Transcript_55828:1256-1573(+)